MTTKPNSDDAPEILERNLDQLLGEAGPAPQLDPAARARIAATLRTQVARQAVAPAPNRRRAVLVGGALAAAVAGAALIARRGGSDRPDAVTVTSAPMVAGDRATAFTLDGATAVLDVGARLEPLGVRHVRVDGRVLLDVTPGHGAYTVETAHGRVEVVGTRFMIDSDAARTQAVVVRGLVRLASASGDVMVRAGEQGTAEPGRAPTRAPAPRLSQLTSWAEAARRAEDREAPMPVPHGTLTARAPALGSPEHPLPLRALTVDVAVDNQVARVAIDQTFFNPDDRELEGHYRFAIPSDAALQRLAMFVDGTRMEAAVVERMKARAIYEDLVYRRVDPALLEYAGAGRLDLKVYPLRARQEKRLALAYTQSLPRLYDDWTLTVPLPEVDGTVGTFDVAMRIKDCARCEVHSPSHAVTVVADGADAVVTLHAEQAISGDSVVLVARDPQPAARVAHHVDGDGTYLLARAPAQLPAAVAADRPARTWIVLDDVSASRDPIALRAQADVVDRLLADVDETDRVAVLAFDTEVRTVLPLTRALDVDRGKVRSTLRQRERGGVGATDLGAALDAAVALVTGVAPADAMVVYLGDGVVTGGERELGALRQRLVGKATFVGVGLGDGVELPALASLADATGGLATSLDLADDLGFRAYDLIAALYTPRAVGLVATALDASGAAIAGQHTYLKTGQLAGGEELEVVSQVPAGAVVAALQVTGASGGAPWSTRIPVAASTANAGYLPRLWATRRIAALMMEKTAPLPPVTRADPGVSDQTRRDARDEVLRKEIVALGKRHFLLSRHTSLLVLENDAMYAQYDVIKGAGATWAPYALPATVPVVTEPRGAVVVQATAGATLRPARPWFMQPSAAWGGGNEWGGLGGMAFDGRLSAHSDAFDSQGWGTIGTGRYGTIGGGSLGIGRGAGTGAGYGLAGLGVGGGGRANGSVVEDDNARMVDAEPTDPGQFAGAMPSATPDTGTAAAAGVLASAGDSKEAAPQASRMAPPPPPVTVTAGPLFKARIDDRAWNTRRDQPWSGTDASSPMRQRAVVPGAHAPLVLTSSRDPMLFDVGAWVPGLTVGPVDEALHAIDALAAGGAGTIDAAARAVVDAARAALPRGTYTVGAAPSVQVTSDGLAWSSATPLGLVEYSTFDGVRWTSATPELGLAVVRRDQHLALAIAATTLPVWLPPADALAAAYVVTAPTPTTLQLLPTARGAAGAALSLEFDAQHRLVAVRRADGSVQLAASWSTTGLSRLTLDGAIVEVVMTPAFAPVPPSPLVELAQPFGTVAAREAEAAAQPLGSAAWRTALRQALAAAVVSGNDEGAMVRIVGALRAQGGLALGDVALASRVIDASSATDVATFRRQATPSATALLDYLARAPSPPPASGLVATLATMRRLLVALEQGNRGADAALVAMRALPADAVALRWIAATRISNRWDMSAPTIAAAWDALLPVADRNLVRAEAAFWLMGRDRELAGQRYLELLRDYDVTAAAVMLDGNARWSIGAGLGGETAWRLAWEQAAGRVLASDRIDHLLALAPHAYQQQLGNLDALLGRATALVATQPGEALAVASTCLELDRPLLAERALAALPTTRRTPAAERVVAAIASRLARPADAAAALDRALAGEAAPADAMAAQRRGNDYRQLVSQYAAVATAAIGADRSAAVVALLDVAARWRAELPQTPGLDATLGTALLQIGEPAQAWRQLSTVIERAPMEGSGWATVADAFERGGRADEAVTYWREAIILDQTNPTPRLRQAQLFYALGRLAEGDARLREITSRTWHANWSGIRWQADELARQRKLTR